MSFYVEIRTPLPISGGHREVVRRLREAGLRPHPGADDPGLSESTRSWWKDDFSIPFGYVHVPLDLEVHAGVAAQGMLGFAATFESWQALLWVAEVLAGEVFLDDELVTRSDVRDVCARQLRLYERARGMLVPPTFQETLH